MDFSSVRKNPAKRFVGVAAVVALHGLLAYALVSGLARTFVESIDRPLEARLIAKTLPTPTTSPTVLATPPKVAKPPSKLSPLPPTEPPARRAEAPAPAMPPKQVYAEPSPTPIEPDAPAPVETAVVREPTLQQPVQPQMLQPVRIAAVVDPNACATPQYPRSSFRAGETGAVTLAFLIGIDGRVVDSRIDQSSGFADLDKAARAGLSLCKFKPSSVDGKPKESWTKMRYVWKLDG